MVRKSFVFLALGMVMFFFASVSSADVPDSINYQGKLTTASGGCLNDTVQMTFTIYADELGISDEWSETQTEVVVKEGIFNVLLGSVNPLPASIFDGSAKYLGVQVESDPEMSPLKPMVSVAYAFRSEFSDTAEYARAAPAMPDDDWVIDGDNIYRELGNVGIGTTSPSEKLHVDGNIVGDQFQVKGNVLGYNYGGEIHFNQNDLTIQASTSDPIIFKHGGVVETARIEANGNVGIGTTSPGASLDIVAGNPSLRLKASSGSPVFTLDKQSGGYWGYLEFREAGASKWQAGVTSDNDFYILNWPASQYVFYANTSGSVGIGTTSPSEKLHVDGNIVGDQFQVKGNILGYNYGGEIHFNQNDLTIQASTSDPIIFKHGGVVETARIEANGNVGIGTTNPQGALDVTSTTGAFIVPRMTTTQRDALTAVNGMIIYNTTTNQFNFYENGAWVTK